MISNLLIDLDGTLTDPKLGIIRCVQYALTSMGREVPKANELVWVIGPPLLDTFKTLLNDSGLDPNEAIKLFRERFSSVGLLENTIYDGIPGLLSEQLSLGKRMFIASTKPHIYINRILNNFNIDHFFERVYGSELDGTRSNKSDLLYYIFQELMLDRDKTIMIGDRITDIEAAKFVKIRSIWVDYGFGDELERDLANPDYICNSPEELSTLLTMI